MDLTTLAIIGGVVLLIGIAYMVIRRSKSNGNGNGTSSGKPPGPKGPTRPY